MGLGRAARPAAVVGWVVPRFRVCEHPGRFTRDTMRPMCQARSDHLGWPAQESDEYPFASTAENAKNPAFDYSTRPIARADNQAGAGYLGGWYHSQRILQGGQVLRQRPVRLGMRHQHHVLREGAPMESGSATAIVDDRLATSANWDQRVTVTLEMYEPGEPHSELGPE